MDGRVGVGPKAQGGSGEARRCGRGDGIGLPMIEKEGMEGLGLR